MSLQELWMRLGVTLSLTDEEVEQLRNDPSEQETQKLILNCLSQGRAKVHGNAYRPGIEEHTWTHDEGLPGFECDLFSNDTLMLIPDLGCNQKGSPKCPRFQQ
ncbi:MAG: hypothetical protein WC455_09205 [Dehalococcoidia bacterium]|jgi:hypothetical protein